MVNGPNTAGATIDRRGRTRPDGAGASPSVLGRRDINPFGDLHTVQHLCARLARGLRPALEPLLRRELRLWAEPLSVQRFADYRVERGDALAAWLPLPMGGTEGAALLVLDGRFVLGLLDLFFGGTGAAPAAMPSEFSPAADALVRKLGEDVARPLAQAWEPLAAIDFSVGRAEANPAMLGVAADDALIVTRFGLAAGADAPVFLDILYPVDALKPHGATLTGKVLDKAEPDPAWRTGLTRAAMGVTFPVRATLAEPVVPLSRLMNLRPGDVLPISFGAEVPVMVGGDRFASGIVGASNGQAAVRLTRLHRSPEGPEQ